MKAINSPFLIGKSRFVVGKSVFADQSPLFIGLFGSIPIFFNRLNSGKSHQNHMESPFFTGEIPIFHGEIPIFSWGTHPSRHPKIAASVEPTVPAPA